MPKEMGFAYSKLSYQEKVAPPAGPTFVMAIVFVFLLLAAMYESWRLPWAVLLGSPLVALGAFFGVWLVGYDNNVYVQVGLIMLIGLAAKNAILIVEVAKVRHEKEGKSAQEAALEAARLRFRPILMTAFAFILGVVPLMRASGAGAGAQNVMGTAVFWGMLVATFLGVFIIPGQLRLRGAAGPAPQAGEGAGAGSRARAAPDRAPGGAPVRRATALIGLVLALAACTIGPDYRRPEVTLPALFRGLDPTAPPEPGSLGDLAWWTIFQDEVLQRLIQTALAENYDLRLAVSRILDAQAQVVITRSNQFPVVEGTAQAPFQATEGDRPPLFTLENSFLPQGAINLSFELDFWGRWRRATEAARADLLATDEARHVVLSDLISAVAIAYFQLRTLDLDLEIAQRTVGLRQDSLRLVRLREEGGVVSLMDTYQAQTLLSGALREIPDFERQIEQTENLISVLLGRNPGPITRGRTLDGQITLPSPPVGLPAALLERRPDVRLAEAQLVAANARIGVAKSEFFPRIFLLGSIGVAGGVQNSVSFGPMGFFGIGPTMSVPIFNMGRVQAGVDSAEARAQEAVVRYQQTVQQALRDVSDALVEHRKRREARREQENLVQVLRNATGLSNVRYDGGVTSYLEVLDNERQLFAAELDLARTQRDELLAVVRLYRALGGGWVQ